MKTKTANAQADAEKAVRHYIGCQGLDIEDDEAHTDGTVTIHVSARDERDIAAESPSKEMRDSMSAHVKALRELSDLVYVTMDTCDEWVNLSVAIRSTPRKKRPAEISNLAQKVMESLPLGILHHPRVTSVCRGYTRGVADGVEVRTNIASPIGKRSAMLSWSLLGDSLIGWRLRVCWGDHEASRPAAFQKLTPKIILSELDRILTLLDDPLDCLGYTIHVRDGGKFLMNFSGQARRTFQYYEVGKEDLSVKPPKPGQIVMATNNYNGITMDYREGEKFNKHVGGIKLT
jgi:hypothetical protein